MEQSLCTADRFYRVESLEYSRSRPVVLASLVGGRSTAAREILRRAQSEDGYEESHPYSPGYEEVLRALQERAYLDGNIGKDAGTATTGRGKFLYGEDYYEYHLRFQ